MVVLLLVRAICQARLPLLPITINITRMTIIITSTTIKTITTI